MQADDATTHDVVVLGAGSGGYACALRAAQLGLTVAMVERDKVGGTCLHRGCIPTKALLHAAEVADAARDSSRFGVRAELQGIDLPALHAYKDGVVSRLHRGLTGLVDGAGITVVTGEGRLTSPSTVEVDGRALRGEHVVLATGSYARTLPDVPLGGRVVTSDGVLQMDELPERIAVLGGGVIGVELASALRSFGSEVTVLEVAERLLPTEEPVLSTHLQRAFRKRGITVRTSTRVEGVSADDDSVTVLLAGDKRLDADLLVVAVGRGPVTDGLGYEEAGVRLDRGFVVTDDRLRTAVPTVFAVGDLVAGPQLAHRGFAHGMFVAEEIAGLSPAPVLDHQVPRVTYCEPEVASIGLSESDAREQYGEVSAYEYPLGGNGRSQILGTTGLVKVVRAADGPVVGVHMIGSRMGEQVGEAQLVVGWEAVPEDVAALVHTHPTQNEALGEAHLALAGRPLHAHT